MYQIYRMVESYPSVGYTKPEESKLQARWTGTHGETFSMAVGKHAIYVMVKSKNCLLIQNETLNIAISDSSANSDC